MHFLKDLVTVSYPNKSLAMYNLAFAYTFWGFHSHTKMVYSGRYPKANCTSLVVSVYKGIRNIVTEQSKKTGRPKKQFKCVKRTPLWISGFSPILI